MSVIISGGEMSRSSGSASKDMKAIHRGKYLLMFRKLVRKVILKKFWQGIFDANLDPNQMRNTNTVFRRIGQKEILFQSEKRILAIPYKERDEVQKKISHLIVARLNCLDIFEPNLRRQLAEYLRYVQYCKGRTVIKERYESNVLYFILSGEITVSKNKWNVQALKCEDVAVSVNVALSKIVNYLAVLGPGDIFGQLGLINEELRRNTYETATACELLYLLKDDFDSILKPTQNAKLSDIRTALGRFQSYFKNWTDAQLEECTILAKLANYHPQDVIYGEDRGLLNYVFFVLHGHCEIIQHLRILQSPDNKFKLESLERKESISNHLDYSKMKLIRHFITIGEYNTGSIFGLGEELKDRLIIAKSEVQCLLLPRYWLFQKDQGNIWNRTKMFLDANIPSREALFREFLLNRRWKKYKQTLINEIPRPNVHKTTKRNIPLICRVENGL